jgi:predicted phage tail protein
LEISARLLKKSTRVDFSASRSPEFHSGACVARQCSLVIHKALVKVIIMLVNVRLVGNMAEQFGYHHQFVVDTAREIFTALAANFPQFRQYLAGSENRGVCYQVMLDGLDQDKDELAIAPAPHNMVITPIITGSGGIGKVIAGLGLLVLSAFAPFSIGLFGYGAIAGSSIGAALLLSGASQLLAGDGQKSPVDRSTTINSVGVITEGEVIPIAYGRVFIKGRVISAGTTVRRR